MKQVGFSLLQKRFFCTRGGGLVPCGAVVSAPGKIAPRGRVDEPHAKMLYRMRLLKTAACDNRPIFACGHLKGPHVLGHAVA